MDVDTQFSARTTDADATSVDKIGTYGKKTAGFPDGQLHWMDENGDAHPVADEDYADTAASDAVTTHETTYDHSLLPTADQKAAMDAANSPAAGNAFATIADVGGGGAVDSVTGGTNITNSGTAADPVIDHDAHTGDVTGSTALTIGNDIVSNAKASDMPANTVKVNATGALADPQDLAIGTNSILGRLAGAIAVLTGTQVTTLLDVFTSTLKGLVPASGGGTANFLRADGTFAAPPGGGGSITTTNINWVDSAGNDGTAAVDRIDLPWLTIGAALTAAASGDVVMVRPGTYAESGLTVPAGVALISEGGFLTTIVGDAAAVAHIITMSAGSYLQGFQIICPTTASLAGVSHSSGTGTVYDLDLRGDGGTGSGDGIYKTGTGKIVGGNIRCEGGGLENLLRVDAAVLALDDVHVPQSTGTIGNVILTEGTGRFQGQGVNAGNTNIGDVIHVAGTSTCIIYSPNWFNVPIGGHLVSDGVSVTIIGGRVDATIASLLIDPALTGVGTTLTVNGTAVQPLFSFPSAAITTMALSASFHQEATASRNAEVRSVGADLTTGFPELGSGLSVGEGSPFSDGQIVLTSDSTASPSSDGSTLTDVSTAAKSKTSSTFTFQGTGAGNSILWCTDRTDAAGVALKHWGVELGQTIAAVGGSFIFEIQTAASTWVEIEVMAVSEVDQFRYANNVFLRASSEETIRAGIDTTTSWAETTISGTTGYWMRARIASTLTTAPVFERMRLIPSHIGTNARGQIAAKGLAHWRSTLFGAGNMWGEGGGAADYQVTVGSGVAADGETWNHKNKKGRINTSNDFLNFNLVIPGGICTAFPLKFRLLMSSEGAGNVDMRMSVLPLQALNNLIADSAGGTTPIARTSADLYNANAAQVVDLATFSTVTDTLQAVEFEGFDISDFYSDDMLAIRVGFDPGGSAREVDIWALSIEGVKFTEGKIL